jgi:hypothetical protein
MAAYLAVPAVAHIIEARERNKTFLAQCTFETCPIDSSYYAYRPSLGANAALAALFGISTLLYIGTYVYTRRAIAFTVALAIGTTLEILGYVGRLMSWKDPWSEVRILISFAL